MVREAPETAPHRHKTAQEALKTAQKGPERPPGGKKIAPKLPPRGLGSFSPSVVFGASWTLCEPFPRLWGTSWGGALEMSIRVLALGP
eukprot:4805969-Pyramimonas_sp.AAC.1